MTRAVALNDGLAVPHLATLSPPSPVQYQGNHQAHSRAHLAQPGATPGSAVSSCIAFILPTSIFIKIQGHKSTTCQLSTAWSLLILSCITSVACTATTLMNLNAPACPEIRGYIG